MPAPLSTDLRKRILSAYKAGQTSSGALASRFKVSRITVWRILDRYRTDGSVEALPHGGGREASIPEGKEKRIVALIQKFPDATTEELARAYNRRWKTAVTRSSMGRTLARMAITSKKKPSDP